MGLRLPSVYKFHVLSVRRAGGTSETGKQWVSLWALSLTVFPLPSRGHPGQVVGMKCHALSLDARARIVSHLIASSMWKNNPSHVGEGCYAPSSHGIGDKFLFVIVTHKHYDSVVSHRLLVLVL